MNMHRLVLASLLFLTVFFPFRSSASEFFKNGSCAIIVAARQSVSETREWIIANDWEGSARVYLSENGWYAIAIGQVRTEAAEQRLAAGKESGLYPNDSYCSSGRLFVREVAWARADSPTVTATSSGLWGEFDARPLTRSEKAFLQASLALQGEYKGLLDGVWGDVSQRALERYTLRSFDREPSNADAAYLSMLLFEAIEEAGWRRHVVDNLAISIVLPLKELTQKESDGAF